MRYNWSDASENYAWSWHEVWTENMQRCSVMFVDSCSGLAVLPEDGSGPVVGTYYSRGYDDGLEA